MFNANTIIDKLLARRNAIKTKKLVSFCTRSFLTGADLSILDLGCGSGLFAKALQQLPNVSLVCGVDVIDYCKTDIPFKQYSEGSTIPCEDNSFDITFIVEVLHHSDNAIHLLTEARRVTKKSIIVFEDVVTSKLRLRFMRMFDILMNMRHGVNTPLNFRAEDEWLKIFSQLQLTHERTLDYSFYSVYTPQHCRVFLLKV